MKALFQLLMRLARLQAEPVDRLAIQAALTDSVSPEHNATESPPIEAIDNFVAILQLPEAYRIEAQSVEPTDCPCLIYSPDRGWGLLTTQTPRKEWLVETYDGSLNRFVESLFTDLSGWTAVKLRLTQPFNPAKSQVFRLILNEVYSHKRIWAEGILAGFLINAIALSTSFYTMQVYDRVVPTGATQTLWVLSVGVLLAIFFDVLAKFTRSRLFEKLVEQVDKKLAREVYSRFLAIRFDQLPRSVGSLAAQLKGYETVRGFMTSLTSQVLIDIPFALLFILVIVWLGGWLGIIPFAFFILSLSVGFLFRARIDALSQKTFAANNFKTGLLVETIEGAEKIKSGQSGWRMLSRWISTTDEARESEQLIRRFNESSQFIVAGLQQVSYVLLVAAGSLMISAGEITMGALIACSILSGRVLGPVAALPDRLIQWGYVRTALQGLENLWSLEDDHHGQEQILEPENLRGHYVMEKVVASYGAGQALVVPSFEIRPGERVGVLGPIGSGKTTLLRLLSGVFKPQEGRVRIDGLDLAHISKPTVAERVGYLQQEGRLFAGTLRENLILGLIDPGDDVILDAARRTGLLQSVISPHPQGLGQGIYEGGSGLSSGQRQLVNLTGVLLRRPRVWLLDEPTASIDGLLEQNLIAVLNQSLSVDDVLVVVTHKPDLLRLVGRIVVVANHQIVMDGPRDEILRKLSSVREARPQLDLVDAAREGNSGGGHE
jgi:ATP-binding cassette subfamily C protein LapB